MCYVLNFHWLMAFASSFSLVFNCPIWPVRLQAPGNRTDQTGQLQQQNAFPHGVAFSIELFEWGILGTRGCSRMWRAFPALAEGRHILGPLAPRLWMGSHLFGFLGWESSWYFRLSNLPECLYCRWKVKCSWFISKNGLIHFRITYFKGLINRKWLSWHRNNHICLN